VNGLPTWIGSTRGALDTCTKTQHFPFSHGFVFILMMYFISKLQSEVKGIQVSFTIGIQTPMQLQTMFQFSHNMLISMDATFGTNNVKYHLLTLMAFYFHHTWLPIG
jgi:hypothetical protein